MKKNNQTYIYESNSYWDKERKSNRTRMVYLGKEDSLTKKITPPGKKWAPKSSRDYGTVFLLSRISEKIGMTSILKEIFPDDWKKILGCVFFEVSEGRPLYLCNAWLENSYNEFIDKLPSQRISELLKSIGENGQARLMFSKLWTAKHDDDKFIVFDISSISSYSKRIEGVEWGYNRDHENLPQVNLGIVFGQPSLLPIFYNVYQGSIRDVSTLKNILEFSTHFKMKDVTLILDKGFYSAENITAMKKKRLNFIIPLPFTTKEAQNLIEKQENKIIDVAYALRVNKQILYCMRDKIRIEQVNLNAYLYFDKRKKLESEERLLEKIMEAEGKVEQRRFHRRDQVKTYLSQTASGLKAFFEIRKVKDIFVLKRNRTKISEAIGKMGYIVILSSRNLKKNEIILLYRNKDCVEKCFDNMKNELNSNRLRIHSKASMEGKLFIDFITLIFYSWIKKTMKENNLNKQYTIAEVMYEIKKLKIIELENSKKLLTEISKKQKNLFKQIINEVPKL